MTTHFTLGECGKRTYTNLTTARQMARNTNSRGPGGGRVSPYHCTRCHGWHVGHGGRKVKNQRRELVEKSEEA